MKIIFFFLVCNFRIFRSFRIFHFYERARGDLGVRCIPDHNSDLDFGFASYHIKDLIKTFQSLIYNTLIETSINTNFKGSLFNNHLKTTVCWEFLLNALINLPLINLWGNHWVSPWGLVVFISDEICIWKFILMEK